MTGFARGSVTTGALTVTVECRSVNNRYLDLQCRMPDNLRVLEGTLRERAGEQFSRGKLELLIRVSDSGSDTPATLNPERLAALRTALSQVASTFPEAAVPDQLALLLSPGVLAEQEPDVEALHNATTSAAKACFEGLREQRLQEGEKLADMVRQRADAMRVHLGDLREQLPALQAANRQRLLDRLQSLDIVAEPMRLEEEIVYVLQRADVEEEMDRLQAHLDAIESALESTTPVGRRLDFLMQELNREANTLGSKSTALSTTNISVEFKVLIEQMREQVQNIE
ncbi:MAG TPA: YicC family protein [Alphaproteobacteria bacterium]|nr:YicC family protein [Alphaproteobacteria bacterium]